MDFETILPPGAVLVGLSGRAGSGKSTLAEALERRLGFGRVRFAGPLKAMLAAVSPELAEESGKAHPSPLLCGRTPRHAMQTLGTEWGRQCIGPDFWTVLWRDKLRRTASAMALYGSPVRLVAEDCRFENEAAAIRALGGVIVRVDCPWTAGAGAHVSESGIAEPDFVIANDVSGKPEIAIRRLLDVLAACHPDLPIRPGLVPPV